MDKYVRGALSPKFQIRSVAGDQTTTSSGNCEITSLSQTSLATAYHTLSHLP